MAKKLLALFGLKFNPFSNDVPVESLHRTARLDEFVWRIQHQVGEGGFALVSGEAGTGKSASLRVLADDLSELRDVTVGVLTRPHASVADFYRELGHLFAVPLTPHNRWAGAKALREKWIAHIGNAGVRPVLLLDEAQETRTSVLNELRLLSSTELDAQSILTVVLAGDAGRARRGQLPRAHDDGRRALARRGAARARATRPGPLHRPVPARAAAREEAEADMSGLPTTLASELGDGDAEPKWLIDGLWSDAAVGVLGGEPKCCKSFLALDAGPALRVIGDDAASDDEAGGRGPADRILAVLSDADRPLRRSEPKKRCAMRRDVQRRAARARRRGHRRAHARRPLPHRGRWPRTGSRSRPIDTQGTGTGNLPSTDRADNPVPPPAEGTPTTPSGVTAEGRRDACQITSIDYRGCESIG